MDSQLISKFEKIRSDFPALQQKVRGKNLIYLDSAATSLKPKMVIDRIQQFYSFETANVHRGAHYLSDLGTTYFENSREAIRSFINAPTVEEVIFTKGTTDAINLVATAWGEANINENDVILISEMEHHANIVPWQNLIQKKSAQIKVIKVLENGDLDYDDFLRKLKLYTPKLVSVTACSNVLGTFNNVEYIIKESHKVGAKVLIDGAQIVAQKQVDVQKLDADFFAFSAHKLFGPFGFGVLFGKKEILESMSPYQFGGAMIQEVSFEKTTYNQLPFKFEAGTPHVEGAIGTMSAINYINSVGMESLHQWDQSLLKYGTEKLQSIPGLKIFGTSENKAAVISFMIEGIHGYDLGQLLDQQGLALRVGHHCTQPLMKCLGVSGTVRASFSIYNNFEDIDQLVIALNKAKEILI